MNAKTKTKNKGHKSKKKASHPGVDAAAASAHDAVDWAAGAANDATDSLSDTGHEMKATQARWLGAARGYVNDNPATSVGIALASGYLLSRIFSER